MNKLIDLFNDGHIAEKNGHYRDAARLFREAKEYCDDTRGCAMLERRAVDAELSFANLRNEYNQDDKNGGSSFIFVQEESASEENELPNHTSVGVNSGLGAFIIFVVLGFIVFALLFHFQIL